MRRANPAAVGGFVIGALALAVGGILFFGGGQFFRDTERFVIFFEGSVNGLQIGSPVKMKGVEIGSVQSIRAIADVETVEILTETVIEIDRDRFEQRGEESSVDYAARFRRVVAQGLRARLELQSLITGQLYIALLVLPETEPRLVGATDVPYPELPAVPTKGQELERTVRGVLARIQELPLEDLITKLDAAAGNLDATLEEGRVAVAEIRRLVHNVDGSVAPITESAVAVLDQTRQTLESVEGTVDPGSPLSYQLSFTLQELADAARAIRVLADYLEQNPNALVFGRSSGGAR